MTRRFFSLIAPNPRQADRQRHRGHRSKNPKSSVHGRDVARGIGDDGLVAEVDRDERAGDEHADHHAERARGGGERGGEARALARHGIHTMAMLGEEKKVASTAAARATATSQLATRSGRRLPSRLVVVRDVTRPVQADHRVALVLRVVALLEVVRVGLPAA